MLQVDDLCQFAAVARTHHASSGLPQVPWLLAGFSLGGLTAALAALRKPQAWAGLVLVSACMWVRMTPLTRVQRLLGPLLNALIPTARIVQQLDPAADLNPDPEAVRLHAGSFAMITPEFSVAAAVALSVCINP